MTDPTAAAERVRRMNNGEDIRTIYDCRLAVDAVPNGQRDMVTLAQAYLAQQPTYAEQAAELAELREQLHAYEASGRIDAEIKAEVATTFEAWWKKQEAKSARYMVEFGCKDAFEAGAEAGRKIVGDELAELRANLAAIVSQLQRKLQPAGSPPPGNASMLAAWIIDEAHKELAELRAKLGAFQRLNDTPNDELSRRLVAAESQLAAFADPTPVDEAWLRERLGGTCCISGGSVLYKVPLATGIGEIRIDHEWTGEQVKQEIEVSVGGYVLLANPTRGQLAKLLSALGAT
jgi:hypothetical protein